MKAELIYYKRVEFGDRYLMEITIHKVNSAERYPVGVKYGLLFLDFQSQKRVLMDNHHPKGPHIHINKEEFAYDFVDVDQLLNDFSQLFFKHFEVTV